MEAVTRYLSRHAVEDTSWVTRLPHEFSAVIVVPAHDEDGSWLAPMLEVARRDGALVAVVVNATPGASQRVRRRNQGLIDLCGGDEVGPGARLSRVGPGGVLCLDRSGEFPLPRGQGVGWARRIGCDVALALRERIASPWIHGTDADARLPADYFERAAGHEGAALVYPFHHLADASPAHNHAAAIYEWSLRYYVAGLRWVHSPWAFHTVGSTLAVHREAYAQVGGMPKRTAGEDFHLLAKLAKVGRVVSLGGAPIGLSARPSRRVPFGTGPSVRTIAADPTSFSVYAPQTFDVLRELQQSSVTGRETTARAAAVAATIGLNEVLARQQLPRGRAQARRQRWGALDALRTLRAIHAARDLGYPDVTVEEAGAAPFAPPLLGPAATPAKT